MLLGGSERMYWEQMGLKGALTSISGETQIAYHSVFLLLSASYHALLG